MRKMFATERCEQPLPYLIYSHNSLIRRKLGNVDMTLQENKAVNLGIAAPKVSGIIIKPGQTFSFWQLVGSCSAKKGYKSGLVINRGAVGSDTGGGMCQFTNLIHWLVLHSPLTVTEHHHHDGIDMFPDFGRQVPFGVGTSIMYNYLDYRVKNETDVTFQLFTYTDEEYLCGSLRASVPLRRRYHIRCENEHFTREGENVYRNNEIYQECVDIVTGNVVSRTLIKQSHARVLYDTEPLTIS